MLVQWPWGQFPVGSWGDTPVAKNEANVGIVLLSKKGMPDFSGKVPNDGAFEAGASCQDVVKRFYGVITEREGSVVTESGIWVQIFQCVGGMHTAKSNAWMGLLMSG